jgi:hypothetical protein
VSRFYLLPSRPVLGERFAEFLGQWFPMLEWPSSEWTDLGERLAAAAADRGDVFVVHGDELPAGVPVAEALAEAFGAEPGDEVFELAAGERAGEMVRRYWRLDDSSGSLESDTSVG